MQHSNSYILLIKPFPIQTAIHKTQSKILHTYTHSEFLPVMPIYHSLTELRHVYKTMVVKPQGEQPLGKCRHRSKDKTKMDQTGCKDVDWIQLAQDRIQRFCEHDKCTFRSHKNRELLHKISIYHPFNRCYLRKKS
jgi:hypothetical protein